MQGVSTVFFFIKFVSINRLQRIECGTTNTDKDKATYPKCVHHDLLVLLLVVFTFFFLAETETSFNENSRLDTIVTLSAERERNTREIGIWIKFSEVEKNCPRHTNGFSQSKHHHTEFDRVRICWFCLPSDVTGTHSVWLKLSVLSSMVSK